MNSKNVEEKIDSLISNMANPAILKNLCYMYSLKKKKSVISGSKSSVEKNNLHVFNEAKECLKILSFSNVKSKNTDERIFSSIEIKREAKEKCFSSVSNDSGYTTTENLSNILGNNSALEENSLSDSDVCILKDFPPLKKKKKKQTKNNGKTNKVLKKSPPNNPIVISSDSSENESDCALQLVNKPWIDGCRKMAKVIGKKRKCFTGIRGKMYNKLLSKRKNNVPQKINGPDVIFINSSSDSSDNDIPKEFNICSGSKFPTSIHGKFNEARLKKTVSHNNCNTDSKQNRKDASKFKKNKSLNNASPLHNTYTISSDSSEESDEVTIQYSTHTHPRDVPKKQCNETKENISTSSSQVLKNHSSYALKSSLKVNDALESSTQKNITKSTEICNQAKKFKSNDSSIDKNKYLKNSKLGEKHQENSQEWFCESSIEKSFVCTERTFDANVSVMNLSKIENNYNAVLQSLNIFHPGLISLKSVVSDGELNCKDFDFVPEPVNFKIPRLHEDEVVYKNPERDRKLIAEGVDIKYGNFTAYEDEILKKNFNDFVKEYQIRNPLFLVGIGSNLKRNKILHQFLKAKHFYLRLGRKLSNRTLNSIYQRVRILVR